MMIGDEAILGKLWGLVGVGFCEPYGTARCVLFIPGARRCNMRVRGYPYHVTCPRLDAMFIVLPLLMRL
jgi:hypothetical protein